MDSFKMKKKKISLILKNANPFELKFSARSQLYTDSTCKTAGQASKCGNVSKLFKTVFKTYTNVIHGKFY